MYLGMSEHGMLVAVKSIPVAPTKAESLMNEIRVLSNYRHEHIVAYLGSALVRDSVSIVMEFMPCGIPGTAPNPTPVPVVFASPSPSPTPPSSHLECPPPRAPGQAFA